MPKSAIEQLMSFIRGSISPEERERAAKVKNTYPDTFSETLRELRHDHFSGSIDREIVQDGGAKYFSTLLARVKDRLRRLLSEEGYDETDILVSPAGSEKRGDYLPGKGYSEEVINLVSALRFMFADDARDLVGNKQKLQSQAIPFRAKVVCFVVECMSNIDSTDMATQMQDHLLQVMTLIRRGCSNPPEQSGIEIDTDCSQKELEQMLMGCIGFKLDLFKYYLPLDEWLIPVFKQMLALAINPMISAVCRDDANPKARAAFLLLHYILKNDIRLGVSNKSSRFFADREDYFELRNWDAWDHFLGGEECPHVNVFDQMKRSVIRQFDEAKELEEKEGEQQSLLKRLNNHPIINDRIVQDGFSVIPYQNLLHVAVRRSRRDPAFDIFPERKGPDNTFIPLAIDCLFDAVLQGFSFDRSLLFESCEWSKLDDLPFTHNPVIAKGKVRLITDANALAMPSVTFIEGNKDSDDIPPSLGEEAGKDTVEVCEEKPELLQSHVDSWRVIAGYEGLPTPNGHIITMRIPRKTQIDLRGLVVNNKQTAIRLITEDESFEDNWDFDPQPGEVVVVGDRSLIMQPAGFELRQAMTPDQFKAHLMEAKQAGRRDLIGDHYFVTHQIDLVGLELSSLFSSKGNIYNMLLERSINRFDRYWSGALLYRLPRRSFQNSQIAVTADGQCNELLRSRYKTFKDCVLTESLDLRSFNPEWPLPFSDVVRKGVAANASNYMWPICAEPHTREWLEEGYSVLGLGTWRYYSARGIRSKDIELRLSVSGFWNRFFDKMRAAEVKKHLWIKILSFGIYFLVYAIIHHMRMKVLRRISRQDNGISESRAHELEEIFKKCKGIRIPTKLQNYLHHQLGHLVCVKNLSNRDRGLLLGNAPDDIDAYLPLFDNRDNLETFVSRCFPGTAEMQKSTVEEFVSKLEGSIPQGDDGIMSEEEHDAWYESKEALMMDLLKASLLDKKMFKRFVYILLLPENALFLGALLALVYKIKEQQELSPGEDNEFFPYKIDRLIKAYSEGELLPVLSWSPRYGRLDDTQSLSQILRELPAHYRRYKGLPEEGEVRRKNSVKKPRGVKPKSSTSGIAEPFIGSRPVRSDTATSFEVGRS